MKKGCFTQHIELDDVWLERARIQAADTLLLNSPIGLAGNRCRATLFFASGSGLSRSRVQGGLDAARAVMDQNPLCASAGATSSDRRVMVVRVLCPVVEPAMQLLQRVRAVWRDYFWALPGKPLRIWAT